MSDWKDYEYCLPAMTPKANELVCDHSDLAFYLGTTLLLCYRDREPGKDLTKLIRSLDLKPTA